MRAWRIEHERLVSGAPQDTDATGGSVEVVELQELDLSAQPRTVREALRLVEHVAVPFVERMPAGAVGVIAAPEVSADVELGSNPVAAPETDSDVGSRPAAPAAHRERPASATIAPTGHVGFILTDGLLRLVGSYEAVERALAYLENEGAPVGSPAGALCELMRLVVRDHPAMLSAVRADFERLEERLLDERTDVNRRAMRRDARRLLGLDTMYQGMSDVADELAEGGGGLVPDGDRLRFRALGRQLDRLSMRLESLQDYSLQLNSLYHETIDIRQNSVMQWLTVIATIFMPLTFITGWYGMNFQNMALLRAPGGYLLVVAVCAAIAVAEVVFFHRRGWLDFGPRRRRHRRRR